MRKLSLFETNKSTNLLTDRMMSDVERLIANISPIITDFETFKLLCLITLFTGAGDTMPTIAKLRNRFGNQFSIDRFILNKKSLYYAQPKIQKYQINDHKLPQKFFPGGGQIFSGFSRGGRVEVRGSLGIKSPKIIKNRLKGSQNTEKCTQNNLFLISGGRLYIGRYFYCPCMDHS